VTVPMKRSHFCLYQTLFDFWMGLESFRAF